LLELIGLAGLILPHLIVAGTAIYRSTLPGFERYFGFLATLSANCRVFLHIWSGSTTSAPIPFPCLTAGLATLRFISVTLLCEKLLLRCSERELVSTFNAMDLLVGKTHWTTSFSVGWLRFGYPDLLVTNYSIKW